MVGGFGGFGGFIGFGRRFSRTTAPAAADFGERRCFWHQTHVESHERIADLESGAESESESVSESGRSRYMVGSGLRLCMFGVSMRINFA